MLKRKTNLSIMPAQPERRIILEREGAVMLRMSVRNFRRWTVQMNILPIDISAPGAKKRSLRYYADEIEDVIKSATQQRDHLANILRFGNRRASGQ